MDEKQIGGIDIDWVYNKLVAAGMNKEVAAYADMLILGLIALILAYIAGRIAKSVLIRSFNNISKKTTTNFDDYLVQNKAFKFLARVVPYIILVAAVPIVFFEFPDWQKPVNTLLNVYMVVIIIQIIRAILFSVRDYLQTQENFKDKPVQSYIQVVMIILYLGAGLIMFSMLTGKSVVAFLTAMGAASAILILVFRDSILGFVASIQVSINDTVRIGDWIEMPKYGADGDVIEINLTAVKVQNWDKTVTTIPTYALISDSFKNWRAMTASGGRRISRSINIKLSSIRHVSQEDMERLAKVQFISDYLHKRQNEIQEYNEKNSVDTTLLINGRHMTNLGVFRQYIEEYLKRHPFTHKDMTMMVRHLAPTTQGIPIQLYAFSSKTAWVEYENIMADMFDHLLACVKYFGLEVFEEPASDDVRYLKEIKDKKDLEIQNKDLTRGEDIDESDGEGKTDNKNNSNTEENKGD